MAPGRPRCDADSVAIPVVLDCDTGTDDAVAIMLAALSPAIDLLGVTTVAGNVPVDVVTENSLRVLQYVGRDGVPVFPGAAEPLARQGVAARLAGQSSFSMHGLYLELPPARSSPEAEPAVEALLRLAHAGPITLVATAPLTNVAAAIRRDPSFVDAVARVIVMGGGHAIGNVTPSAEFNFWADPEAAREVLAAGFADLTLVPLDATHAAVLDEEDCRVLRSLGTPAAMATAELVEQRIRAHDASQPMAEAHSAPVHDALCVAELMDPAVLRSQRLHVDVEVGGELTVGRSVIDLQHRGTGTPNATVAVGADAAAFNRVLRDTLGRT